MATTNEEMYIKDWQESIPQMTTEELSSILSKAEEYNPQYVEIVKEEFAKRPQTMDVENDSNEHKDIKEDVPNEDKSEMPSLLWIIVLFIGLAGVGSLRYWNVPMFILSMYCVWLFIYKKENSINVAQSIFIINLCVSVLFLIFGSDEYRMGGWLLLAISGIALNLGCYYYLGNSDSVEMFIPKDNRYLKNMDYFLIGLPVLFYLIVLIMMI